MISNWIRAVFVFMVILVGIARIVSTYTIFSHTVDEGAHISAGMQLLDKGVYNYEAQHPPLARVAVALGPYLTSLRSPGHGMWKDGLEILYSGNSYFRTLSLARAGILVFFVTGVVVVWVWTRHLFDDVTAIVAAMLFSLLPVILAHSGLATTDMAITTTLFASVYAVTRWFEHPSKLNAAVFGGSLALAILSKLTALLLFPACLIAVVGCRYGLSRRAQPATFDSQRHFLLHIDIAAFICLFIVWCGYGFSLNSMTPEDWPEYLSIGSVVGASGRLHDLMYSVFRKPIYPFVELVRGIYQAFQHGVGGHASFFLGEVTMHGNWLYYPVMIFFKTPLAFLILVGIGLVFMGRLITCKHRWQIGVPIACVVTILLAMLPSTINIGVRHVLPIFPFLAIIAAVGAVSLYRSRGGAVVSKGTAVVLVGWVGLSSISAHPDYLAYFNFLAGPKPEWIVADSDLDWGQDQERLSQEVAVRHIDHLWIRILGSVHRPFPPFDLLEPHRRVTGWVAISLAVLKTRGGEFGWLEMYRPVVRVGNSILLYDISPKDGDSPNPIKSVDDY